MSFSESLIQQVWSKGKTVLSYDPNIHRKDDCGAWMTRSQYGNRNSRFGWEIHHVIAESLGGTDDIYNIIPLQWENNVVTGDGNLMCAVTSNGNKNVGIT